MGRKVKDVTSRPGLPRTDNPSLIITIAQALTARGHRRSPRRARCSRALATHCTILFNLGCFSWCEWEKGIVAGYRVARAICGTPKGIRFYLHTSHVLFHSTILIGRLVLALTTTCLGGVRTEFFVRWMGWTRNCIDVIGGYLRGRLLRFRITDNNKTATLLFAIEDW